jgi:O-antigen/teichoic acid export membrane protein
MSERTSAVQVARSASYILMQTLITTVIQVVAFAFIARLISTTQMGLLAILALMVGLAQLIAPLSLPSAIARFVAEELAQGRREGAAAVFYQSTKISLTLSAIMALACFMSASQLSAALSAEPIVFRLLAVDILLTAGLTQTLSSALVGTQKFREYSVVTVAYAAIRQALIVALLILLRDFSWLIFAWVLSDLSYVLMMSALVIRALGPPGFEFSIRELLRFSVPLMPGNSINFAYSWYDRALLLPYVSLSGLGIYNATLTAFNVLSAIPSGMAGVLYPAYAEIQSVKGKGGLEDAIHAASRYISFIAVPLTLGLFATARPALALFVGQQYEYGSTALQILTFFFCATLLANAFGNILLLLGMTATASSVAAASVIGSLGVAFLLLPQLGIDGAAVSRGVGMIVSFGLTLALARGRIRLPIDLEALWKSFTASLVMGSMVWLAQYLWYDRHLLPAYVVLGGCVYLIGLRLLRAVRPSDIHFAKQFLGKRYEAPINVLSNILKANSTCSRS